MPHILLYEFLSAGGWPVDASASENASENASPNASLVREGAAMLAALAADFAAIPNVKTTVVLDARQGERAVLWSDRLFKNCDVVYPTESGDDSACLVEHCRQADWTVVIAPEFDRILDSRLAIVESAGGRLLGPSTPLAALAADKQRMAEHLAAARVPAALGRSVDRANLLQRSAEVGYPSVLKPRWGAGSQDVWLLSSRGEAERAAERMQKSSSCDPATLGYRLERFYPGKAASVAVLCGPGGLVALRPCLQRLSDDGRFRYLGGACPLEPALAERAVSLAIRAVRSLPGALGYIGIDMVLGPQPDGRDDVVIELNPRLTTSYVGLRDVAASNLAAAMLQVAEGTLPEIHYHSHYVEFDSDGTVRRLA